MTTITYAKTILSENDFDVVVLGGGPSGIMAAAAAAKNGAKTAIIEQYGFLGGMATAGLVAPISVFCYHNELVVGGMPWDFVKRMEADGGAKIEYPLGNVSFSPECYKLTADRLMRECGVTVYFHTRLIDCIKKGHEITHVILQSKCGLFALEAKMFIDCTGDADLAAFADVPMLHYDSLPQPASLYFCLNHVDTLSLPKIHHSQQGINYHMEDLRDLLLKEGEKEKIPEFGGPWMCYMMSDDSILVNMTRKKVNILNESEASDTEMQLREDAFRLTHLLKENVKAFSRAEILYTACQIGVRESRHVKGVHVLTGDEYLNAVKFDDSIGRGCHPVDIHAVSGHGQRCQFLKQAAYIPYRSIITEEISNLFVACRAYSADQIAFASTRVQACVMGLGQAAGVAAAQCVQNGCNVQDANIQSLKKKLTDLGANLS